jgi:hypothetical protein
MKRTLGFRNPGELAQKKDRNEMTDQMDSIAGTMKLLFPEGTTEALAKAEQYGQTSPQAAGLTSPQAAATQIGPCRVCNSPLAVQIPVDATVKQIQYWLKEGTLDQGGEWLQCTNPDRSCPQQWSGFAPPQDQTSGGVRMITSALVNWSANRSRSGRLVVFF